MFYLKLFLKIIFIAYFVYTPEIGTLETGEYYKFNNNRLKIYYIDSTSLESYNNNVIKDSINNLFDNLNYNVMYKEVFLQKDIKPNNKINKEIIINDIEEFNPDIIITLGKSAVEDIVINKKLYQSYKVISVNVTENMNLNKEFLESKNVYVIYNTFDTDVIYNIINDMKMLFSEVQFLISDTDYSYYMYNMIKDELKKYNLKYLNVKVKKIKTMNNLKDYVISGFKGRDIVVINLLDVIELSKDKFIFDSSIDLLLKTYKSKSSLMITFKEKCRVSDIVVNYNNQIKTKVLDIIMSDFKMDNNIIYVNGNISTTIQWIDNNYDMFKYFDTVN